MNSPLASVIVVNYNGRQYLKECLNSLISQTYKNQEIILVDNASTDGSSRLVKELYSKHVKVIENAENWGFARANNIGILASSGKYVVVLNNDTRVEDKWLEELINAAEHDDQVGMCAAKILLMSDPETIDSAGVGIYLDGSSKQRGWLEKDHGQYEKTEEVLLPSGCAALYRRKMLDEIGLFDEKFFAYCEDTDLGLRGRLAGWKCLYVPRSRVYHHYSGYWTGYPLRKIYFIERNRLLLIFKLFPLSLLIKSGYYFLVRLYFHLIGAFAGKGVASQFINKTSWFLMLKTILKAHVQAISLLPAVLRDRWIIRKHRKISDGEFIVLMDKYRISARTIALN